MACKTLIDAKMLLGEAGSDDWRIFDCRCSPADPAVGLEQYRAGHVPGARHADLDTVLAGKSGPNTGRHPLPDRNELARWLGREGVGEGTQIIAYDDSGGAFAARLWWLSRWLGHEAAAVLDGGLSAWREAGGKLERGEAEAPAPADFQIRKSLATVLSANDALEIVQGRKDGSLVDARAAPRYRGEEEPIDPVAGHIAGAQNRPFAGNLDDDGRFLDAERLRARFDDIAADPREVVHYCGSGVTACHNVLAMEHAGLAGSRLYAGSWSEWIRDPERPMARGENAPADR